MTPKLSWKLLVNQAVDAYLQQTPHRASLKEMKTYLEEALCLAVLDQLDDNQFHAAVRLEINRGTLRKIRQRIDPKELARIIKRRFFYLENE